MSIYTFNLNGPIAPKARARTTANGTFLPHKHQDWQKKVEPKTVVVLSTVREVA